MRSPLKPVNFILALAHVALFSAPPQSPGPLAKAMGLRQLSLGASIAIKAESLEAGHAQFHFSKGRMSPVLANGGQVGWFFDGFGSLTYESQDPTEQAAVKLNLDKGSKLKAQPTGQGTSTQGDFHTALFLWAGAKLPAFQGEQAETSQPQFTAHRGRFAKARISPPAHDFAVQVGSKVPYPLLYAELGGGAEDLIYEFDAGVAREEALYQLRKPEFAATQMAEELYSSILSEQPIQRSRKDILVPSYTLSHVDLELVQTAPRTGRMTVKETLIPRYEGQQVLRFQLQSRYWEWMGNAKLEARYEKVKAIRDGEGRELAFSHDTDDLVVELQEPAKAQVPMDLTFEIEGDFLIQPDQSRYWELGTSPWFPQPDLNGQMMTWHAVVKVKKPWIAFSNGDTVRRSEDGEYTVLETRSDKPIAFPVILAGEYQYIEDTRDGITVRIASFMYKPGVGAKVLNESAFRVLKYYQNFLGAYPYKELNIIEKNEWGYGQAPAGIMFITKEAFNQSIDIVNRVMSIDIRSRFAHEIAHQWWGTVVKMPSQEEQWITEAFAEYCAALYLRDFKGPGEYKKKIASWKSNAAEVADRTTIPLANRVHFEKNWMEARKTRTYLIYDKGAYLLYALHNELGDDQFFTFLKSMQRNFAWKFASTKHVAGMLQAVTKKDFTPYFDQFYWGTGMPTVKE